MRKLFTFEHYPKNTSKNIMSYLCTGNLLRCHKADKACTSLLPTENGRNEPPLISREETFLDDQDIFPNYLIGTPNDSTSNGFPDARKKSFKGEKESKKRC